MQYKMNVKRKILASAVLGTAILLSGCNNNQLVAGNQSVGVRSSISVCPQVAIAAYTGDVTTFNPANSTDSRAIDIVASMTGLRSTCQEQAADIYSEANFIVRATRNNNQGARSVTLPYYSVILRGGSAVVSKTGRGDAEFC